MPTTRTINVTTSDGNGNETTRQVTYVVSDEQVNSETVRDQALQALTNNRAYVGSTPTAAQTTAQVKALSRQVNGLIRLLLGQFDGTD